MTVDQMLQEAAELFADRNAEYGNSFEEFGRIMRAFFPGGISVITEKDMNRLMLLLYLMGKLHRYTQNFEKGGHEDSLKDIAVYATMLRYIDRREPPNDHPF